MSFSRQKYNSFRQHYTDDVTMVLDGEYYRNNKFFKKQPYDYFSPLYKEEGRDSRSRSEAEERVISQEEYIPLKGLKEVHVAVKKNYGGFPMDEEQLLEVEIQVRMKNIPTWYYETTLGYKNKQAFLLLDKKKAFTNLTELFVEHKYPIPK